MALTNKVFFDEPKQIETVVDNLQDNQSALQKEDVFRVIPKCALAFSNILGKTFFKAEKNTIGAYDKYKK